MVATVAVVVVSLAAIAAVKGGIEEAHLTIQEVQESVYLVIVIQFSGQNLLPFTLRAYIQRDETTTAAYKQL